MKLKAKSNFRQVIDRFTPSSFIYVTGTAMSANLLHSFPYPAYWLKVCSYIMFAIGVLIFFYFHLIGLIQLIIYVKDKKFYLYLKKTYMDFNINVFWGIYIIAFTGLINYLIELCADELAESSSGKGMVVFVYVLWWLDLFFGLCVSWGITFINWKGSYFSDGYGKYQNFSQRVLYENLKSTLLLTVIPLVVVSASAGLLCGTQLFVTTFNRNIQLLTIGLSLLLWAHAFAFVFIVLTLFYLNLYINKLPPMKGIFSMFIVLGPLGMGGFGVLLITRNIYNYSQLHYPIPVEGLSSFTADAIQRISVPWAFRICGLMFALIELCTGFFFSIISIFSVASYFKIPQKSNSEKTRYIYHYHRGWWTLAFPVGSMALGVKEIYIQYRPYVPIGAFRVVAVIYYGCSIIWCIICLIGMLRYQLIPFCFHICNHDIKDISLPQFNIRNRIEHSKKWSHSSSDDSTIRA